MTASPTIVRVRTELAAVPKAFDYAVPSAWEHNPVTVGTRVRVPLHGRSVRGWVVDDAVSDAGGREVLPLKSWLGWGPRRPCSSWRTGRRGAGRGRRPRSSAPRHRQRSFGRSHQDQQHPAGWSRSIRVRPNPGPMPWRRAQATVVRLPPATDLLDLVLSTLTQVRQGDGTGSVLVLVPSAGWAHRLASRLARRGWPATTDWAEARAGWPVVVGSRAGAWAPVPQLAAAVVLDAHDAAYREESSPTYSAVEVVLERRSAPGRTLPCRLADSAGDSDRRRRARQRGADRHPRAGGLAHAGAGRSPERRPAHRPVLRRVRPTGAPCAQCPGLRSRRDTLGLRLQPDRRGPPAGLRTLRRAGPLCPLWSCRGKGPRDGAPRLPALWRDSTCGLRALRPPAHEDSCGPG